MRSFAYCALLALLLIAVHFQEVIADDKSSVGPAFAVESITPSGDDLEYVKQIVIKFNKPIAHFPYDSLEPLSNLPIDITPKINCKWTALGPDTVACNMIGELTQATTYSVVVYPSMHSADGKELNAPFRHSFTTSRPRVLFASVKRWASPGKPVVFVAANQKLSQSAVEQSFYFVDTTSADGKRYAVIAEHDYSDKPELFRKMQYLAKVGVHGSNPLPGYKTDWILRPKDELPHDMQMVLMVDAGLSSVSGTQKSLVPQELIRVKTFGSFKLIDVQCVSIGNKMMSIMREDLRLESGVVKCNPTTPLIITFNNPVVIESLRNTLLIEPEIKDDPSIGIYSIRSDGEVNLYEAAVKYNWQAATRYQLTVNQDKRRIFSRWGTSFMRLFRKDYAINYVLHDEFGQKLSDTTKLKFYTGNANPDFRLPDRYVIIDSSEKISDVSIETKNLDSLRYEYMLLTAHGIFQRHNANVQMKNRERNKATVANLPLDDVFHGKSGAAFGQIASVPKVDRGTALRSLFVEHTPLSLHASTNGRVTLVTLFDRRTSALIDKAKVSLIAWNMGNMDKKWEVISSGITKNGFAIIGGTDNAVRTGVEGSTRDNYYILAEYDDLIALLPLESRFLQKTDTPQELADVEASWGITEKTIYRPGEEVNYKLYVRNQNLEPGPDYKSKHYELSVIDQRGAVVHSRNDMVLSDFGSLDGSFFIPTKAVRGQYVFVLNAASGKTTSTPLRLFVDDYQTAYSEGIMWLSKVITSGDQVEPERFIPSTPILVNLEARLLHNGEPLQKAPVSISCTLNAEPYVDAKFKDFYFANKVLDSGPVFFQCPSAGGALDESGKGIFAINLSNTTGSNINHGNLHVETLIQDASGKYLKYYSSARFFRTERLVGLKIDNSAYAPREKVSISAVVIDTSGEATVDTPIKAIVERRVYESGSGSKATWKKYATVNMNSYNGDIVTGDFFTKDIGSYRIVAEVQDGSAAMHKSHLYFHVIEGVTDNLPAAITTEASIEPTKSRFQVGEKATYIVNNPFEEADAVIMLVRDGFIDSFNKRLPSGASLLEIDMKPEHAPGFYMYIDILTKAADDYMLSVKTPVFNIDNKIALDVKSDKSIYKPGDAVRLSIDSNSSRGKPIELAIIVADKATLNEVPSGLLDHDPHYYFNQIRSGSMRNYSLFGRGKDIAVVRDTVALSSTAKDSGVIMHNVEVAYWNPSVTLQGGNAIVDFTVPNKIAEWVVIIIAADNAEGFGSKITNFSVRSDVEVLASIPSHSFSNDKFESRFIVYNKTNERQGVNCELLVNGNTVRSEKVTLDGRQSHVIRERISADSKEQHIVFSAGNDVASYVVDTVVPIYTGASTNYVTAYRYLGDDVAGGYIGVKDDLYFNIYAPVYERLLGIAKRSLAETHPLLHDSYQSWPSLFARAISLSIIAKSQYAMKSVPSITSHEAQNIIFAATQYQSNDGAMLLHKNTDHPISNVDHVAELTARTAMQFEIFKSDGYIVPLDVERKMLSYLRQYYKNWLYDWQNKDSLRAAALVARALGDTSRLDDTTSSKSTIKDCRDDVGVLANYSIALGANQSSSVIEKIRALSFETSGSMAVTGSYKDSHMRALTNNCDAWHIFYAEGEKNSEFDHAHKMARYIMHSMPDMLYGYAVTCLESMYAYARLIERDFAQIVSLNVDGKNVAKGPLTSDQSFKVNGARVYNISKSKPGTISYSLAIQSRRVDEVNHGISVSKERYLVRGDEMQLLLTEAKVGDVIKTDIKINAAVPLLDLRVSEPIPGGVELLHRSHYGSNDIDPLSLPYELANGSFEFHINNVSAGHTYNISYWSYAKMAGDFAALATYAAAEGLDDIYGHTADTIMIIDS